MNRFARLCMKLQYRVLSHPLFLIMILGLVLFALLSRAQTPPAPPVIQATTAQYPPSLAIFAEKGDLTYCTFSALTGTTPRLSGTCRRSGITIFSSSLIPAPAFLNIGDVAIAFTGPGTWAGAPVGTTVKFSASANVRTAGNVVLAIASATGEFQPGATVTETSPDPSVSARVVSWNAITKQLTVTMVAGQFTTNATIRASSGAQAQVVNLYPDVSSVMKAEGLITWPTQ